MALDEPTLVTHEGTHKDDARHQDKRDDAPDYYKRPKFKRNIIPFDTEDLSVQVIRERFLIPNQVKEESPAAKAGLKLGDQIVTINGADASAMRLATAESVIKQAGEQLHLVVAKDDEEATKNPEKPKETREIKFAGNENKEDLVTNPSAPKHKPDEGRENWIQPPERKVWHPIVWQQPPPPVPPEMVGKEKRHLQLITNIRRLLTESSTKPDEFNKHIERMMLALPSGSRPITNDDEDWDAEPAPEPEPPKPKPKKKKGKKVRKVVRKRTESETSEDSASQDVSASIEPESISEEA